jgi:hypothetical protein
LLPFQVDVDGEGFQPFTRLLLVHSVTVCDVPAFARWQFSPTIKTGGTDPASQAVAAKVNVDSFFPRVPHWQRGNERWSHRFLFLD